LKATEEKNSSEHQGK